MERYSEEQLAGLCKDISETEYNKIENAIRMVEDAVRNNYELYNLDIDVFVQGSYANNTNVKVESDVDVCVMLKSIFYYYDYKKKVITALQEKFGTNVKIGNKAVNIKSNTYRVEADVVIAVQYRNYRMSKNPYSYYIEGIKFFSECGDAIINYPKIHTANGNSKDEQTRRLYKKLVRIFKNIKNDMIDKRIITDDKISSFLIESLIYNVPNDIITYSYAWNQKVKEIIYYLYNEIKINYGKFVEVSECNYLFHEERKWTPYDVKKFLFQMWNYLGFGNGKSY